MPSAGLCLKLPIPELELSREKFDRYLSRSNRPILQSHASLAALDWAWRYPSTSSTRTKETFQPKVEVAVTARHLELRWLRCRRAWANLECDRALQTNRSSRCAFYLLKIMATPVGLCRACSNTSDTTSPKRKARKAQWRF